MSFKNDFLIPTISGVVVTDSDGKRIAAKYYNMNLKNFKAESDFESRIHNLTKNSRIITRGDADMITVDNYMLVFRMKHDVLIHVLAPNYENELLALRVLHTIEESLTTLLHNQVSKKTLVENLDLVLLAIDEIIDDGLILEDDPSLVSSRVAMNNSTDGMDNGEVITQSLAQAFQSSKDQFFR